MDRWKKFFDLLAFVVVFAVPVILYLMEKAGKSLTWIFVVGWLSIAAFALYLVLSIPWVWRPTSTAAVVWRVCFVCAFALLITGYGATKIWPKSEERTVPQTPDNGERPTPASQPPSSEVKKEPPFTSEQMEQFKRVIREAVNNSKAPTPVGKTKDDGRPFLFTIDVALFSPSRDRNVMLYLASPGAEGMCIYPANLALYLRLQNLQRTPSRLAGWNLELAYGKDWVEAVSLDSRFGTIYFAPPNDPQHAGRVDSNAGFDVQLASKSYTLNPSESVEGWALFEYPKAHPFFAGGYKLRVSDTLGHKWSGEVSWPDARNKDLNLLGGSFRFTGLEDVSRFHIKFAGD